MRLLAVAPQPRLRYVFSLRGNACAPMQQRSMSGVRLEIMFLLFFIVVFVGVFTLLNATLLPRHYNPIVVLILASIIVGLLTIFARYFFIRRPRR